MNVETITKNLNSLDKSQIKTAIQPNLFSIEQTSDLTVAAALVKTLENLGVRYAFGLFGGGITPFIASLEQSSIEVLQFRHEAGAVFAAIESYFASGHPVVVFSTTGPGITNALTGLFAARWEGAKIIFVSPCTSATQRGRWAFQETSQYTMSNTGIFTSGALFHYAIAIESSSELPEITRRLALGVGKLGSFVAHISIPRAIQTSLLATALPNINLSPSLVTAGEDTISKSLQLLCEGPFAIWVGFGARDAALEIRQLAERTGAAVMSSPRGKGIFPEDHPQFVGVTGFGGQSSVLKYMQEQRPLRVLVLGTKLGEFTSFWNPIMVPARGFVHVDIDPEVPGAAYPYAETFAVQSDIGAFVKNILKYFPEISHFSPILPISRPEPQVIKPQEGLVRPEFLMYAIQKVIVENSDAIVMTEAGNSFAWGTNRLRFAAPGRYRVSTGFGSMGHAGTGILGAALAGNRKAVAILGDGAMLMNSEISTAVKHKIPAVWIVLNDGRYNMCDQGMNMEGFHGVDAEIPSSDFVMIARGMGADGIRVNKESDVEVALEKALALSIPFVLDVIIDPTRPAPIGSRIDSLILRGK
ncbi:MAG: ScyA-related TPP-binding enzyme [Nostoc sp. ChiSLP01]|nr:ScyA-related TPP-binding enzyme [Nostoc sp. CmiSLP01]MDZ8286519.1 ScyA-related TPP-binding enzyme [Nostoc sp. ChiSLP01]